MAQSWCSIVESEMESVDEKIVGEISTAYPELYRMCYDDLNSIQHKIRTGLLLLSYYVNGGADTEKAVAMGMSLEPVLIGLQMHDKIDGNGKVMGRKKLFSKDLSTTKVIVSGDYMYVVGVRNSYNFCPPVVPYINPLSIGWSNSVFATERNLCNVSITEEECIRITDEKSFGYQVLMEAAADVAGCDEDGIKRMKEYGRMVGMAIKVTEDIWDFVGNGKDKPEMSCFMDGRITLPIFYAMQSNKDVRDAFSKGITYKEALGYLTAIKATDSISKCKEFINECLVKAKEIISGLKDSEYKSALLAFTEKKDLLG